MSIVVNVRIKFSTCVSETTTMPFTQWCPYEVSLDFDGEGYSMIVGGHPSYYKGTNKLLFKS